LIILIYLSNQKHHLSVQRWDLQEVISHMTEQITMGRKRKPLIDRLREVLLDDDEPIEGVITKGKLKKLRHKFDEPKTLVDEGIDGWGDDVE